MYTVTQESMLTNVNNLSGSTDNILELISEWKFCWKQCQYVKIIFISIHQQQQLQS